MESNLPGLERIVSAQRTPAIERRTRQFGSNFSNLRVLSTSEVAAHNSFNSSTSTPQTTNGEVEQNTSVKKFVSNVDKDLDDISDSSLANDDQEEVSIVEESWEAISEGSFGEADDPNSGASLKNAEFSVGYRQGKCQYFKHLKPVGFFRPKIYVHSKHRSIVSCVNMQEKAEELSSEPEVFYIDDETSSESVVEIEQVADDKEEITEVTQIKVSSPVDDVTKKEKEPVQKPSDIESGDNQKDPSMKKPDFYQGKVVIQECLDSSSSSLIGVEFVVEVWKTVGSKVLNYNCFLCKEELEEKSVIDHLTSTKHRIAYLVKYFPSGSKKFANAKSLDEVLKGELETMCNRITADQERLLPFISTQAYVKEHYKELGEAVENTKHYVEEKQIAVEVQDLPKLPDDNKSTKSCEGKSISNTSSLVDYFTDDDDEEAEEQSVTEVDNAKNMTKGTEETLPSKLRRQRRKNRNRKMRRKGNADEGSNNLGSLTPGMGFLASAAQDSSVLQSITSLKESKHIESNKKLSNEIANDKAKEKQTCDKIFVSADANNVCSVTRKVDATVSERKNVSKNNKRIIPLKDQGVSQKESKGSTQLQAENRSFNAKQLNISNDNKSGKKTERKYDESIKKCPHKKADVIKRNVTENRRVVKSPLRPIKCITLHQYKSPVKRPRSPCKSPVRHLPPPPRNLVRHSQSSRKNTVLSLKSPQRHVPSQNPYTGKVRHAYSPNKSLHSRSPQNERQMKNPVNLYKNESPYKLTNDDSSQLDKRRQSRKLHVRRSRSTSRPRYRGDSPQRKRSDSLSRFRVGQSKRNSTSPRTSRRSRSRSRSGSLRRNKKRYVFSRSPISRSRSRSRSPLRVSGRGSYDFTRRSRNIDNRKRSLSPLSPPRGRRTGKRRRDSRSHSRERTQTDISDEPFTRGIMKLEEFSRSVRGDSNSQQHTLRMESQAQGLPFHSGGLPHHYNPQFPLQQHMQVPYNVPPPNIAPPNIAPQNMAPPNITLQNRAPPNMVPPHPVPAPYPNLPHVAPNHYVNQPQYNYPPPNVLPPTVAPVPFSMPQPHPPVINPNPVPIPHHSPQNLLAGIEKSSHVSPIVKEKMFRDMRDQVSKIFGSSTNKFMVQDNASHYANFSESDIFMGHRQSAVNPSTGHSSQQLYNEADELLNQTLSKIKDTLSMSSTTNDEELKAAILELLPKEFFQASAAASKASSMPSTRGEPLGIKPPTIPPNAKVQFKESSRASNSGSLFPIVSQASSSGNISHTKSISSSRVDQSGQKVLAQRLASVLVKLGMVDVSGSLLSEMLRTIGAFDLSIPLEDISEKQIVFILKECGYMRDM